MVKAVLDQARVVVNIIALDDETKWAPAEPGQFLLDATAATEIGGTHDGTQFVRKPTPIPRKSADERIAELEARLAALEKR